MQVLEEIIQPACDAVGLDPVRADGLARAGEITAQVFRRLRDDDVVIADVTGANPNVMYELGLRHTRNAFTLQIGEYGRLPFDVNVIRTIMFSRSPAALIRACQELTEMLRAGLAGEWDPVSATVVWNELPIESEPSPSATELVQAAPDSAADRESPGFLDLVVEMEASQDDFIAATEAINAVMVEMSQRAEAATEEMAASDARGEGMRGRLAITTRFAASLDEFAERFETHVERFEEAMAVVSSGNLAIIEQLEEDPSQLAEVMEYAVNVRRLARISRESLASIGGFVESLRQTSRLSRVLRSPTTRIIRSLDRFSAATQVIDEWDRRLQALGVPVPPDDDSELDEPTTD